MSDLAELGMRFTTQGAEAAAKNLDAITEKSAKAENATDALSDSQKRAGTASGEMDASIMKTVQSQQELLRHTHGLGGALGNLAGDVATGNLGIESLTRNGGNAAHSLFSLGGRAALVGGIVGGLAVTVGVGAKAWLDYDESVRQAENALLGVGRGAGLTTTQFMDLAGEAAKAGGISEKSAQTMATAYLRAGVVHADVLKDVTALTRDYAAATGQDLNAAQSELAKVLDGSTGSLTTLEDRIGVFDDKTRQHLITLIEQNRTHEYQKIVLDAAGAAFAGAADNVNLFDKALKGAGTTWNNTWGGFGEGFNNFFRINQSTEQQLARRDTWSSGGARYDPIRERLAGQLATEQAATKANADQEEHNRLMRDARAAAEALMPWERQRASVLGQISTIERGLTASGGQDAQLEGALRAAQVQLSRIDATSGRDGAPKPRAGRTGPSAEERHAASLVRELEAMKATTQANYDLATAYGVSDAAGLEAAARAEIVGRAVKRQGDIDAFVAAQLEVNASKASASAAQTIADLKQTAEGRERMNALVAAGTLTEKQATDQLSLEAELRPLIASAKAVEGKASDILTKQIKVLTEARERDNAAARAGQIIASNRQDRNQLDLIGAQAGMIGASDLDQAVAMARMTRTQQLGKDADTPEGRAAIQLAEDMASAQVRLNQQQTAYNLGLEYQLTLTQQIDAASRSAADGMASAFGVAGQAMGDVMTGLSGYQAQIASIDKAQKDYQRSVGEFQDPAQNKLFDDQRTQAAVQGYGDMLSAAKGYFTEGSDGYRALQAAEAAYRAFQFAMSVQAMVQGTLETTASAAGAGIETAAVVGAETVKTGAAMAGTAIRTPLKVAEGAASMFAALGPFAFPAVAAMIAILAALGMKGSKGGGGGGSSKSVDASVTSSQGYAAQQEQAKASFTSSLAQKVDVRVSADRDGITAFVAETAGDVARPMVMQGMAAASGATRAQVMADLDKGRTYSRGPD